MKYKSQVQTRAEAITNLLETLERGLQANAISKLEAINLIAKLKKVISEINNFADVLFSPPEVEVEQVVDLPSEFVSLANKKLPKTAIYPINYLESRGVKKSDIIKWKIGYCSTGKYAGRVIVPSFGSTGQPNYFVSRSYDNNWKKYLNPTAGKNIIFNELYLDFDEDLVIVEGVFDALVCGDNAVPLLGSTLTEGHPLFEKIVQH